MKWFIEQDIAWIMVAFVFVLMCSLVAIAISLM